jgi:hypothetical protein
MAKFADEMSDSTAIRTLKLNFRMNLDKKFYHSVKAYRIIVSLDRVLSGSNVSPVRISATYALQLFVAHSTEK